MVKLPSSLQLFLPLSLTTKDNVKICFIYPHEQEKVLQKKCKSPSIITLIQSLVTCSCLCCWIYKVISMNKETCYTTSKTKKKKTHK